MGISSAMGSQALVPAGFGFRNLIINGDMRIAQRGTSFTSTGGANNDNTYNLDRWVLLSDGNNTVNVSQSTEAPTGGLNSLAMTVVTANLKFGVLQVVEQQNILGAQNQTVWLSFKARTSGSSISNVKAVVLAWTGTADSVTRDVVSTWGADGVTPSWAPNWGAQNAPSNLNVTNSWAEYRVQALCDAASIRNLAVFIWNDDTSTTVNDILYVDDVQLEVNNVATSFERRPVGVELALCQRYYYRVTADADNRTFCGGFMDSTTVAVGEIPLPYNFRARPTALETTGTASNYIVVGPASTFTCTSLVYDGVTTDRLACVVATVASGMTAGRACQIRSSGANRYLAWSAEL